MAQLELDHLKFRYGRRATDPLILEDVTMHLQSDRIIALVGESGSGKTTLGKIAVGLISPHDGVMQFNRQAITRPEVFKTYRRAVQMVHQDPYASLNPTAKVLDIIGGGLLQHRLANRRTVRDMVRKTLEDVGLPATEEFILRYPNQLSGGQRQRVSIGRAIALQPELVVADESVSMLDVSMRVSMLDLLLRLKADRHVGYLFITHDFGVVRYFAEGETVNVMYRGVIIEQGICEEVIAHPLHPYTALLLASAPVPDPRANRRREAVPTTELQDAMDSRIGGCRYRLRCSRAQEQCAGEEPPLGPDSADHQVACFYPN